MCTAFSIVEIFSNSEISISLNELSKLAEDRYFQIILSVVLVGSKLKSEFVLWAKWKSSIDFSDISLLVVEIYPNR